MNCTNITTVSFQEGCLNQSNTAINLTLQPFQNNSQMSTTPPYTPAESLARLIAYICIMVPALIGNIFVIICFITDRELRSTINLFILNMAITDLLTAIFRMGFNVVTIATIRGWTWPFSRSLCQFNGYMQGIVQISNVLTLLFMAVFRYIVIVHSKGHLVTKFSVLCTIGISWILSMIEPLLPIIGWNRYRYQAFEIACFPDWAYDKSFPIFIMVFIFAIPLLVMMFCYAMIYWTIKKNSKRVCGMSEGGLSTSTLNCIARREAKVTRAMFIVFATFLICFGPYVVCLFILFPIFGIWVGKDMAFFCGWMANFNSVINPVLYPLINDRFKTSYYRFLCRRYGRDGIHNHASSSTATGANFVPSKRVNIIDIQTPIKSNELHLNGNSDIRSDYVPQECDLMFNDFDT